jgi:hypothetical protein
MIGLRVIRFLSLVLLVCVSTAPQRTARAAQEPVLHVRGDGSSVLFKGQPLTVYFHFTAERDAIGVVTGQARFSIRGEPFGAMSASEVAFAVKVQCLAGDGTFATLGGTIVQSTAVFAPLATGQQVVWRVLDAAHEIERVDQISPVIGGLPAQYCTHDPNLSGFPDGSPATMPKIRSGTIEVHSETLSEPEAVLKTEGDE